MESFYPNAPYSHHRDRSQFNADQALQKQHAAESVENWEGSSRLELLPPVANQAMFNANAVLGYVAKSKAQITQYERILLDMREAIEREKKAIARHECELESLRIKAAPAYTFSEFKESIVRWVKDTGYRLFGPVPPLDQQWQGFYREVKDGVQEGN